MTLDNLKWKNRTLSKIGNNLTSYFPEKAKEVMGLRKGMNYTFEVIDKNEVHIYFREKQ